MSLLAGCVLTFAPLSGHAQNAQRITTCGTGTPPAGTSPLYMDATGNLCSSATLSGSVTATTAGTASAAPTPVAAGTGKPLNISTNSELFSSLSIGGTVVPAGHGTAATALRVELPTDGTGKVGLNAGSAIVGQIGIDQTTPGTTNAVSATNFPTTAALGHGTAATALRVELPTDGTGIVGLGTGTANIGVTGVAQGSTTSGQNGDLVQGSVLTAAPLYTTGQTAPLSLTTGGSLRTILAGTTGTSAMQGFTAAATANATGVGVSGVYLSTPPTLTNSQAAGLQFDARGNTRTVLAPSTDTGIGITPVVSASGEATHVLKASAGNLYSVYATNLTSTAGFLVVLNATSAPADGAITPLDCVPLPASGNASINYGGPPAVYATGITAVVTSASTCFSKTTGVITAFIKGATQ